MVFPILGGNGAVGGYAIDNSLRFNDGDSAKLALSSFSPLYTFSSGTWSLWLKRGHLGTDQYFFSSHVQGPGDNKGVMLRWTNDYKIRIQVEDGNNYLTWETSALFRDISAWYHIHVTYSGTNIMDESYWTLKVNGVTQSGTTLKSGSQSTITLEGFSIGARYSNSIAYLDGYVTEYYFIDGSVVDVSNFAEADSASGIWKPKKYTGTYGTKGFYLDFENSGSLGADQSGNGNNFTPTNLASTDQTTDTPTNNFATILPMANTSLSEGNLKLTTSRTGNWDGTIGTFGVKSGKWYHEVRMSNTEENFRCVAGWIGNEASQTVVLNGKGTSGDPVSSLFYNYAFLAWTTPYYKDGTYNGTSPTASSGDIINIAVDFDNGKIWFGINGTYYNNSGSATGNPSAGTNESISSIGLTASEYVPFFQIRSDSSIGGNIMIPNFGQDGSFAGTETAQGNADGNGYGDFYYAPPTGFLSLNSANLATVLSPTIDDGSSYFHTQLYTGNGVDDTAIINDAYSGDFQPDFLWIKERSSTSAHRIFDSNRGASIRLEPNATLAEATDTSNHKSFDTDGFTLGTSGSTNENGQTYVAWQLKANAGSTSSNTDGTITSTVQANTTAGFSIVTYTGTGATDEIGHGLGVTPKVIITKSRTTATDWIFYTTIIDGSLDFLRLNTTASISNSSATAPNSSVFYQATGIENYVAYCFAEIEGYSKFGKYTGNGSTDGPFVYTGFRPAFVMVKRTDSTANWYLHDNQRAAPYNPQEEVLQPNTSDAVQFFGDKDFVSNGFKIRDTASGHNASGGTYIYMAFAESPFVTSTSIPVTAR